MSMNNNCVRLNINRYSDMNPLLVHITTLMNLTKMSFE